MLKSGTEPEVKEAARLADQGARLARLRDGHLIGNLVAVAVRYLLSFVET